MTTKRDYKKEMISRMMSHNKLRGDPAGRSFALTKSGARDLFRAVKNHKKLPEVHKQVDKKDSQYKKLSIEEYEKKYGLSSQR